MNDISPIAHAVEASAYQNTRYTNILDSAKTEVNDIDGFSGKKAQHNPYKIGYKAGQEELSGDLPKQLFVDDSSRA